MCPRVDTDFTIPTQHSIAVSIVRKLHPVADGLRDLQTRLGMRGYRVRLLRTRWTGGVRGRGDEVVVMSRDILPVPKLSELDALSDTLQAIGLDEVGTITMSEISSRYTEEFLRGYDDDGTPAPRDENVYYEIEFIRPDSGLSDKRRFYPVSAPWLDLTGSLGWQLKLERSHEDRTRTGEVQ